MADDMLPYRTAGAFLCSLNTGQRSDPFFQANKLCFPLANPVSPSLHKPPTLSTLAYVITLYTVLTSRLRETTRNPFSQLSRYVYRTSYYLAHDSIVYHGSPVITALQFS